MSNSLFLGTVGRGIQMCQSPSGRIFYRLRVRKEDMRLNLSFENLQSAKDFRDAIFCTLRQCSNPECGINFYSYVDYHRFCSVKCRERMKYLRARGDEIAYARQKERCQKNNTRLRQKQVAAYKALKLLGVEF